MARVRKFLNVLNGWDQVAAAQEANAAELPQMEAFLVTLRGLLEQARSLSAQQAALTAGKQEVSKQLRQTIRQGQKLVDVMRRGARAHFGVDSEKLVEWGVQPFRGRARKEEAAKPPEKPETPETKTPDSASPASSPETTK